jgi:membrane associated rhomboid family serine protease
MILDEFKKQFAQPGNSVIKLLWINSLVFFAMNLAGMLLELVYLPKMEGIGRDFLNPYLTLSDDLLQLLYRPWTLISTIFSHWDLLHLASNMLGLYFIGQFFVSEFGDRRLLALYIIGGIGANIFYLIVQILPYYAQDNANLLGASGAVISLLVALATVFPNREVMLLFALKVKLVWVAVIAVALSVISITGGNGGGEICHLGGALMGFVFGKLYQNGTDITKPVSKVLDFIENLMKPTPKMKVTHNNYRTENSQKYSGAEITQHTIDQILDKLRVSGYPSLTTEEKRILFEYSKQ